MGSILSSSLSSLRVGPLLSCPVPFPSFPEKSGLTIEGGFSQLRGKGQSVNKGGTPKNIGKTMKTHSYENETRELFAKLQGAGFRLVSVDNGEELTKWADVDAETFLAEAMACDESTLRVVNPQGQGRALWLVYGNGPGELVCDYTDAPDVSAVVDACYASAQEGGAL